ncbi:hypothetical protein [Virgibacillus necropolis]|uniref:YesK-like protein n=1 Tax=Virgibacillus necropolis TaxID=163877 RepID=A0A221MHF7_9BACI|nr:hypothetical protein [Virgibacillus necropolis]ASN07029.1 hypothetical protein CFK40_19420 [Virgibacillus necropolis]
MDIFIFIGGCLAVASIVLVIILYISFPHRKFIKYLPSIILIIAGIALVPLSLLTGRWTGTGVGLIGLMAFILGVVVLLICVILDTASKK